MMNEYMCSSHTQFSKVFLRVELEAAAENNYDAHQKRQRGWGLTREAEKGRAAAPSGTQAGAAPLNLLLGLGTPTSELELSAPWGHNIVALIPPCPTLQL